MASGAKNHRLKTLYYTISILSNRCKNMAGKGENIVVFRGLQFEQV